MASIFKRGDVYYVQYLDESKKWKMESCGKGATRADAERIKNEKERIGINYRNKAPVRILDANLLVELKRYRDTVLPNMNLGRKRANSTIERYCGLLTNYMEYVESNGWQSFKEITNHNIQDFINYLTETQKAGSVIMHRLELNRFFKWAVSQSFLLENPMTSIVCPKTEKREKVGDEEFFSESQLIEIFNASNDLFKNIFRFLYLTGLRIGELGNAQYGHITERNDPRTGKRLYTLTVPVAERSKTKRKTSLPLCDEAIAIIQDQKRNIMKSNSVDARKYIFVDHNGDKLRNSYIYNYLLKIAKKINLPKAHPHMFRHTFASHLVMKGVSLFVVKELCRHADMVETLRYAHLSEDKAREGMEKLSTPQPTLDFKQFEFKTATAANAG